MSTLISVVSTLAGIYIALGILFYLTIMVVTRVVFGTFNHHEIAEQLEIEYDRDFKEVKSLSNFRLHLAFAVTTIVKWPVFLTARS